MWASDPSQNAKAPDFASPARVSPAQGRLPGARPSPRAPSPRRVRLPGVGRGPIQAGDRARAAMFERAEGTPALEVRVTRAIPLGTGARKKGLAGMGNSLTTARGASALLAGKQLRPTAVSSRRPQALSNIAAPSRSPQHVDARNVADGGTGTRRRWHRREVCAMDCGSARGGEEVREGCGNPGAGRVVRIGRGFERRDV